MFRSTARAGVNQRTCRHRNQRRCDQVDRRKDERRSDPQRHLQRDTKFDTSTDALIALKKKGASDKVISAMIGSGKPGASSASRPPYSTDANALPPTLGNAVIGEKVIMIDDGNRVALKYEYPSIRSKVRALGFGGVESYYVLPGTQARTRTSNKTPEVVVALNVNTYPDRQIELARWEQRSNGTREILAVTATGTMATPKDQRVALSYTKLDDQSNALGGSAMYSIQPIDPLPPGEYAFHFSPYGIFEIGIDP